MRTTPKDVHGQTRSINKHLEALAWTFGQTSSKSHHGGKILFGVEAFFLFVVLVRLFVDFISMFDVMLFSSFLLA